MNDLTAPTDLAKGHDDTWIATSCALCYASCSIRVHRVDGVVVKVEGNPESAVGKGVSGIMTQYDSGIQRAQHHGPDRAQRNAARDRAQDPVRCRQLDEIAGSLRAHPEPLHGPDRLLARGIRQFHQGGNRKVGGSREDFRCAGRLIRGADCASIGRGQNALHGSVTISSESWKIHGLHDD